MPAKAPAMAPDAAAPAYTVRALSASMGRSSVNQSSTAYVYMPRAADAPLSPICGVVGVGSVACSAR